jgi:hypothetical protein
VLPKMWPSRPPLRFNVEIHSNLGDGFFPIVTMISTGGQRSLTKVASFNPSIDPGMSTSVKSRWMSCRASSRSICVSTPVQKIERRICQLPWRGSFWSIAPGLMAPRPDLFRSHC